MRGRQIASYYIFTLNQTDKEKKLWFLESVRKYLVSLIEKLKKIFIINIAI